MKIHTVLSVVFLAATLSLAPYAAIADSDAETAAGIRYQVVGREPILLIHGAFLEDALVPTMRQPELSGFQLIHYHRRGFGGSVAHDGAMSMAQEADDAVALLDELSISKAHIVGYSSGGVIAYQFTVAYPDRVASLSLIEPALNMPGMSEDDMPPFLLEAQARMLAAYESGDIRGAVDIFQSLNGDQDWQSRIDAIFPGGSEKVYANGRLFFELEGPAVAASSFTEADARAIRSPVLLIVSDSAFQMTAGVRALFKEWIPQTTEALIENADHSMPFMRPEPVAQAIAGFVAANPID